MTFLITPRPLFIGCMLCYIFLFFLFFFFSSRRRHTRSLCDWSSDVCSSDLRRSSRPRSPGSPVAVSIGLSAYREAPPAFARAGLHPIPPWPDKGRKQLRSETMHDVSERQPASAGQIGRASCRERGWGGGADG